jgi:hypothetical protein
MKEAVDDSALGSTRRRGEQERRKSLTVDGGRLRDRRGAPRRRGTQGGAGESG